MERVNLNSDESEESDDEWFYTSIRRYDDLLIYDVQGFVSCATFRDDTRLILAFSREQHHEIWQLIIPEKLVAGDAAGLTKNRDFSLLTAGYTKSKVVEMACLSSGVAVSGSDGVHMYSVPKSSDATDVMSLSFPVRTDTRNASVAATDSDIYCGSDISSILHFDIQANKAVTIVPSESNEGFGGQRESERAVSGMVHSAGNLFIGQQKRGHVMLYEPRIGSVTMNISPVDDGSQKWTMDVESNGYHVAIASYKGSVSVYDRRNTSKSVFSYHLGMGADESASVKIRLSPTDPSLSVSGFDKFVHVLNYRVTGNNCPKLFMHDGHRGQNVEKLLTHLWHPSQARLLLSADNTGKVHAWRFR